MAETLKKNGDMRAWRIAGRLESGDQKTRIDWAHDSAWRFMPLVRLHDGGLVLHQVDLAINKVLTLAGRDEARDFVDILACRIEHILSLGATGLGSRREGPRVHPGLPSRSS